MAIIFFMAKDIGKSLLWISGTLARGGEREKGIMIASIIIVVVLCLALDVF